MIDDWKYPLFRYPFQINKSILSSVGAQHTWPTILAALTWLIQLIQYNEESELDDGKVNDWEAVDHEKASYNIMIRSYQNNFLTGGNCDVEEQIQAFFGVLCVVVICFSIG